MNWGVAVAAAIAGYLLGSISFARIVGRWVAPEADLTSTDLELPGGATIEYGGIVTGVGDMAKAFVPVLAARLLWPDDSYHLMVAVAVVFGHNYPLYHGFRGGRGQSPLYGGLLAIDWLALPVTTAIGTSIGLFLIRDMMWAYTLGQVLLIPWFMWRGGAPEVAYAVAVNLLFAVAMIPEIRAYFEKRRRGELEQVSSWKQFRNAHPAMGTGRLEAESDE